MNGRFVYLYGKSLIIYTVKCTSTTFFTNQWQSRFPDFQIWFEWTWHSRVGDEIRPLISDIIDRPQKWQVTQTKQTSAFFNEKKKWKQDRSDLIIPSTFCSTLISQGSPWSLLLLYCVRAGLTEPGIWYIDVHNKSPLLSRWLSIYSHARLKHVIK